MYWLIMGLIWGTLCVLPFVLGFLIENPFEWLVSCLAIEIPLVLFAVFYSIHYFDKKEREAKKTLKNGKLTILLLVLLAMASCSSVKKAIPNNAYGVEKISKKCYKFHYFEPGYSGTFIVTLENDTYVLYRVRGIVQYQYERK